LAQIPLATLCDLRSIGERLRSPNDMPVTLSTCLLEFDVRNDLQADQRLTAMLVRNPTHGGAESVMLEIYRRFPRYLAPTLQRIFARLLDAGAPMLIHCAAGKDRTGFVVAVLLRTLGFTHETVEADYLSSRDWRGVQQHRVALTERLAPSLPAAAIGEVLDAVLDVRVNYLAAAFSAITEQFGSLDRYLNHEVGVSTQDCERLCQALLE
jgi:protein-tyrosine phosphatase